MRKEYWQELKETLAREDGSVKGFAHQLVGHRPSKSPKVFELILRILTQLPKPDQLILFGFLSWSIFGDDSLLVSLLGYVFSEASKR